MTLSIRKGNQGIFTDSWKNLPTLPVTEGTFHFDPATKYITIHRRALGGSDWYDVHQNSLGNLKIQSLNQVVVDAETSEIISRLAIFVFCKDS